MTTAAAGGLKKLVLPLLIAFPWSLVLAWIWARSREEKRLAHAGPAGASSRSPSVTLATAHHAPPVSGYLQHLREAAWASRVLDQYREPALAGDVGALTAAPDDLRVALAVLGAPMTWLEAARDLNVCGASPAVVEAGVESAPAREAVRAFQAEMGQAPTGELSPDTTAALRYAAGSVHAEDMWGPPQC